MVPSIRALSLCAVVLAVASATPIEDWKTAVGWDGSIEDPSAIGTPLSNATHALQKRTVGGVYICTDINWGGRCGYAVQPLNTCIVLGDDWNKQISSFGPDPCTFCNAYSTPHCEDPPEPWEFGYPGDATGNYGGVGGDWNDQISSFSCTYEVEWC